MSFNTRFRSTVGAAILSFALFIFGIASMATATYAAGSVTVGGKALVTNTDGDNIRVRDGAGTKYDQVAEAHEGETATVLDGPGKDSNGNVWYKVRIPGGTGWIRVDFLAGKGESASTGSSGSKSTSKAGSSISVGSKAVVANTDGDNIRVRDGADTQHDQIAEAHEGETATILAGPTKDSKGITWYKVQVPGGTGWMMADFLAAKSGTTTSGSSSQAAKPAPKTTGGLAVGSKASVTNTDGDSIRVRDGAGTNHDQIASAQEGDAATILAGPTKDSKGDTWYKVQVPGGSGWMLSSFLAAKSGASGAGSSSQSSKSQSAKPGASTPKLSGFARVSNTDGDPLRIRSNHNRKGSVLTTISPDTTVAVKKGPVVDDEKITWYQVTTGGVTGWAMGQYMSQAKAPVQAAVKVQPKAQAPAADAHPAVVSRGAQPSTEVKSSALGATIVGTAMKYLGSRYVFGGMSPRGFDCSGFVAYVVNKSGKRISRDMYSQYNSGTRISSSSLQPGDLLFFSNTYKRGLSHTGIYIGNGKFIHAENESTGVTISSVWSAYWAAHYTGAVHLH